MSKHGWRRPLATALLAALALPSTPAFALRTQTDKAGLEDALAPTPAAGLEEPWAIVKKRMGSDVRFYGPADAIGQGFVNELKRVNNPDHPIRWLLGRTEPAFGVRWTVSGPTRSALPTLAALKRHERQLARRFKEPSLTIHASKPRRDATGQYSRQITLYGVAVYDYDMDDEATSRLIRSLIVALTRQLRSPTQLAIPKPTIGFPPETVRLLSARLIGVRIVDRQRSRHAGLEEPVQYYWDVAKAIEAHPVLRAEVERRAGQGQEIHGVLAVQGGLRWFGVFGVSSAHEVRTARRLLEPISQMLGDEVRLETGKLNQTWSKTMVALADWKNADQLQWRRPRPGAVIDVSQAPTFQALLRSVWRQMVNGISADHHVEAWSDGQDLYLFHCA